MQRGDPRRDRGPTIETRADPSGGARRPTHGPQALTLALALACGPSPRSPALRAPSSPTATDPRDAPAPVAAPAATDATTTTTQDPLAELAARAIYADAFTPTRLYTWTTATQAAALRQRPQLLVAEAATGRPSPFSLAIDALAARTGPAAAVARLLRDHPELRRRRYAWPSAYATVLGLGPRRYGDQLIAVDLDPRAWIARFEPAAAAPLTFVDLAGAAVSVDAVLAEPGRLAAVYHLRDGADEPIRYREFVLCSEAMIREWSLATPEIEAEIAREIALLQALREGPLSQLPAAAIDAPAAPRWGPRPPRADPLERWQASLAFDNRRYRPTVANLGRIIAGLAEAAQRGPPLVHPRAAAAAR